MNEKTAVGQCKTVLVFQNGGSKTAVLSTVSVRCLDANGAGTVKTAGAVQLDPQSFEHVQQIILPLVKRILVELEIQVPGFELSIANAGAASLLDTGMTISGFSADLPIFMALLSAALDLPLH